MAHHLLPAPTSMMPTSDVRPTGGPPSSEDLRQTLCLLQSTLNATSRGVVVLNDDGSVADFNPEFASMWSLPDALLACRDARLIDWIVDQVLEPGRFRARLLAADEEPQTLALRDGRVVECEVSRRTIGERAVARVWSFSDVTEKRRAERELRDSEERYRVLFEHNPQPILVIEAGEGGRILAANAAASRCYGYAAHELPGLGVGALIAPSDEGGPECFALEEGAVASGCHVRKDGSRFDVEVRSHPLAFEGRAACLAVVTDVTERKRMEDVIRLEALIFENINDAVIVTDLQGRIIDWSPGAERMYGYTKSEMLGRLPEMLKAPGAAPEVTQQILDTVRSQGRWSGRMPIRRRDGSLGTCDLTVRPLRDARGTPIATFGVVRDITEQERAEEELRRSEERFRLAGRATDDVIWDWEVATGHIWWGEAVKTRFGYRDEDIEPGVVGWKSRIHPEDAGRVLSSIGRLLRSGDHSWREEYRFRRADGSYAIVLDRAYVVRDGEGQAVRMIGAMSDLSESRQLEEQLRQSQKMEALGRLAGGIAHDFNNLLTAVMGYCDLALRRLAEDHPATRNLTEIRKAGERATLLAHRLLSFSRKQPQQAKVLDLNHVMRETEHMLRRLIGEDVELVTELAPELHRVKADPGQLEQVLVNLAVNARDAMPSGGRLSVRTANVELDEQAGAVYPGVAPGQYVMLYVSDNGCGMDEQVRRHAFEPFFTTKRKGEGTGLGLATVYGIVKQCGGGIRIDTEPGHGAAFTILLPAEAGALEKRRPRAAMGPLPGGSETVLLVEDEEAIRRMAREILEGSGYRVLEAGNGEEAVRLMASRGGAVDLLLTDVIMPGMSGCDLARQLSGSVPGMRVLYMSGYPDEAVAGRGVRGNGAGFLAKPFTPEMLANKIREVLASDRATA
jgi:two-component system, cell cycle sensor histidine kinase and response regulator CckA